MKKILEAMIKLRIDLETGRVKGDIQSIDDLNKEMPINEDDCIEEKIIASWDEIKEWVKENLRLTNLSYDLWIKPIEISRIEDKTIYLKHFVDGAEEFVEKRYFLLLQGAILKLFQENYRLVFE